MLASVHAPTIAARGSGCLLIDQEDRAMTVTELGHRIGLAARRPINVERRARIALVLQWRCPPTTWSRRHAGSGWSPACSKSASFWSGAGFRARSCWEGSRSNGNFTWMIPVANLIIFGAFGLILGFLGKLGPRWGARIAFYFLSFLSAVALLLAIPGLPWLVYAGPGRMSLPADRPLDGGSFAARCASL